MNKQVRLEGSPDIVAARQASRELARKLGFSSADQTRLATAVSEIARNAVRYANGGSCAVIDESDGEASRIRVTIEDHGPGIADIDKAMEQGYTTKDGLGAGLPGARRLVHDFIIESKPGHTMVSLLMMRKGI